MADLYHRVSGRIAPVIVSKGPGLLNAVGACASAMHESSPVMIIAGGSTTHFLGKAGMQEIYYQGFEDATSIFRPICKGTWMLVRPDTTIEILNYALKTATSGRPGPVFVEVPYDIQLAQVEGEIEAPSARAPHLGRPRADAGNVERIARMIAEAERPLLLAGGGVVRSAPLPRSRRRRRSSTFRPRRRFPPKECCRRIIRYPSARSGARVLCAPRARAARPTW
jgi:acetolactate synthase-1/2/3 large subunit